MPNIYKYRGKLPGGHLTISGESWVTGDLVHIKGEPHIYSNDEGFCLKVIPESVGLWLMNRNGQDIYQGDVLEYIDPEGKKQLGVIRFGEYDFAGGLHTGFYVEWADRFVATWMRRDIKFWFTCREVRIIGNIHDNPKLLEVSHG